MMNLSSGQKISPAARRGIMTWIAKAGVGLVLFALVLFLPAGRWDWGWGWLFLGLFAAAGAANVILLGRINPALLAERSKGLREKGAKGWDQVVTGLAVGLLPLLSWLVAALDERFDWSPALPLGLHLAGMVSFGLGWGVVLWAMASNAFFTTTVRIQKERGHTVQTGGPYRWVRHPGYLGAIIYQLATPFLLGSWWSLLPMLPAVALLVLRTAWEDRLLRAELEGYPAYARRVRCRLVPGVW